MAQLHYTPGKSHRGFCATISEAGWLGFRVCARHHSPRDLLSRRAVSTGTAPSQVSVTTKVFVQPRMSRGKL
jgi:hypothetical protein